MLLFALIVTIMIDECALSTVGYYGSNVFGMTFPISVEVPYVKLS